MAADSTRNRLAAHLVAWMRRLQEIDPLVNAPDPRLGNPPVGPLTHLYNLYLEWARTADPICWRAPETFGAWLWALPSSKRGLLGKAAPLYELYKFTQAMGCATNWCEDDPPTDYRTPKRAPLLRVYLAAVLASPPTTKLHIPKVATTAELRLVLDCMRRLPSGRIEGTMALHEPDQIQLALTNPRLGEVIMDGDQVLFVRRALCSLYSLHIRARDMPSTPRSWMGWMRYARRLGSAGLPWDGVNSSIPLPRTNLSLLSALEQRVGSAPNVCFSVRTIVDLAECLREMTLPRSTKELVLQVSSAGTRSLAYCLTENLASLRFARLSKLVVRTAAPRWSRYDRLLEFFRTARERHREGWWADVRASLDRFIPCHMYGISGRIKAFACPYPASPEIVWGGRC